MRGGRRGSLNWTYEVLISLVLIGLFAVTVYPYIMNNADGSTYFSKFYAADLGTTAELANAGNGEVLLRYDNLKTNLDLAFWLENGVVIVGRPPERLLNYELTIEGPQRLERKPLIPPVDAAKHHYGIAREYPTPTVLLNPSYLALRKSADAFSITRAEFEVESCPAEESVPIKDARWHLQIKGQYTQEEKSRAGSAFTETLALTQISITPTENDATHILEVEVISGEENTITFGPASSRLSCLFSQQIQIAAFTGFDAGEPSSNAEGMSVTITTDSESRITPEQVGRALAQALARYYS